jgi:hypothetical protein
MKRAAKGWGRIDPFCPGIDKARFAILAPVGNHAPEQSIQAPLFRLGIVSDSQYWLVGRDVVADGQIWLSWNGNMIDPC